MRKPSPWSAIIRRCLPAFAAATAYGRWPPGLVVVASLLEFAEPPEIAAILGRELPSASGDGGDPALDRLDRLTPSQLEAALLGIDEQVWRAFLEDQHRPGVEPPFTNKVAGRKRRKPRRAWRGISWPWGET
jgi:hypothetical protein